MTLANEIAETFRGFKTFTFRDIRIALTENHRKISDKTIQVTISRMVKKGRIYPVMKGVFSLKRDDGLVGFAFSPFYYGGMAALMVREMIDDQVKMEVMTTRTVKRSFVDIYGGSSRAVLHHLPKKYYFGFGDVKYGSITVPVSDAEKTLIDLFYYRIGLPIQDYSELLRAIRRKRLMKYLKPYNRRIRNIVTNFVRKYKGHADAGELRSPY